VVRRVEENTNEQFSRLAFTPPVPPLQALPDDASAGGRWTIAIDDHRLTGGTWFAEHDDDGATAGLDVSERWKSPPTVPLLIRLVSTVAPVFLKWPTTYPLARKDHAGRTARSRVDANRHRRLRQLPPSYRHLMNHARG